MSELVLDSLTVKSALQVGGASIFAGRVDQLATPTATQLLADETLNGVRTRWVKSTVGTLLTTGDTDTDIATITIPYAKWYFTGRAIVEVVTAAATVAATVLILRTAADGGGTALTAGLTLTGMTAADKYLPFVTATLTAFHTSTTVSVRQTTDSGAAGTIVVYLEAVRID